MNIGLILGIGAMCFLIGFELGCWKEGRAVAKMAEELSEMYRKDIMLLVNKILESRKDKKGSE